MRQIFEALSNALKAGEHAVLATITESRGSTPRKAGSMMLVRRDGSICGTVGGGAVEYHSIMAARDMMQQQCSGLREFSLSQSAAADIGMVCGGMVKVYLQYFAVTDENIRLCETILQNLNNRSELVVDTSTDTLSDASAEIPGQQLRSPVQRYLVLDITDEADWQVSVTADRPETGAGSQKKLYAIPMAEDGTVYIFGAGHVAQELVPVLAHLGFRCVVIDDRADFSCPELFPDAAQTLVLDMEKLSEHITIAPCDYVCIMTRGHIYDYLIQKQVLPYQPCYIGVMGSRNKIRVVTGKLMDDGFSEAEIASCRMPIGTDIKAETPAEIAISIAGELIAVRADGRKAV